MRESSSTAYEVLFPKRNSTTPLLPLHHITTTTTTSTSTMMEVESNNKNKATTISSAFVLPAQNGGMPQFPMKLYGMLDEAERGGYQHVVSWLPGGKSFKIHDPNGLVPLLNLHFNQTKYKSFLRQLQNYGIKRIIRGTNKGICTHEFLQKGRMDLCLKMQRISKSTSAPSLVTGPKTTRNIDSSSSSPALFLALPKKMKKMPRATSTGKAEMTNAVFDLTRRTQPGTRQQPSSSSSMFLLPSSALVGLGLTGCTDQALQDIEKKLAQTSLYSNKKEDEVEEQEKEDVSYCFLEDFEPSALMMDPDGVVPSLQEISASFHASSSSRVGMEGEDHSDEVFGGNACLFFDGY